MEWVYHILYNTDTGEAYGGFNTDVRPDEASIGLYDDESLEPNVRILPGESFQQALDRVRGKG